MPISRSCDGRRRSSEAVWQRPLVREVGCLRAVLPPDEAPDPMAAFVAGAGHDGGKIWHGDDLHEVPSALAIIEHGLEWGLLRLCRQLCAALFPSSGEPVLGGRLLLPYTIDALIMMYSDMMELAHIDAHADGFDEFFHERWNDITQRARIDDPRLLATLPAFRSRVYDGCAVIEQFLTTGYDPDSLQRFRTNHVPDIQPFSPDDLDKHESSAA
jgi:hypothetical protein